ncbi:hypothetical protein Bbelb_320850 [Branchiostoma belcheri]|nr:hypothetical protein Bbelb_320850 [Branchiostoma belcheri]
MAGSPGGREATGFDFDKWCLENSLHQKVVDYLRSEDFTDPELLAYFSEKDTECLRSDGVGKAHVRKLEAAIRALQVPPSPHSQGPNYLATDELTHEAVEATPHPSHVFTGHDGQTSHQYETKRLELEPPSYKNVVKKPEQKPKADILSQTDRGPPPALPPKPKKSVSSQELTIETDGQPTPDEATQLHERKIQSFRVSKPAKVKNFRVKYYDDTSVEVAWDPPREVIDGYKLEVTKTTEPSPDGQVIIDKQRLSPDQTSASCTSLQESTSYTIKLVALSGFSKSDPVIETISTSEEYTDTIPNRSSQAGSSSLYSLTTGPLYQHLRSEQTPSIHKEPTYETPTVSWKSNLGQNWSTCPEVINSNVRNTMTQRQRQLQEANFEVLKTEGSYFHSMTHYELSQFRSV